MQGHKGDRFNNVRNTCFLSPILDRNGKAEEALAIHDQ